MRFLSFTLCSLLILAGVARAGDPAPPDVTTGSTIKIEKDRLIYKQIKDGVPFESAVQNPAEVIAYNEVMLHTRKFSHQELEAQARRDVTLKDLFRNTNEFRLELVYLEGRLRQLRRTEPTAELIDAGVKNLYECWIFPTDEKNPICVLVTELPAGLEPQKNLKDEPIDRWVAASGYFFKKMAYESRQSNPSNPDRNIWRESPVLMGRSLTLRDDLAGSSTSESWHSTFLPVMLGGITGLGIILVVLTWYLRRTDRHVAAAMSTRLDQNPFNQDPRNGPYTGLIPERSSVDPNIN